MIRWSRTVERKDVGSTMATIRAYHRPTSVAAALDLLDRPDVITAPLAGGTSLNTPHADQVDEVVDLQAVGLDGITEGAVLEVGAMVTLRQFVDHPSTPPMLRDLARREGPNTIRNVATIGGTIANADPESGLVAGLLATGAVVTLTRSSGVEQIPIAEYLTDSGRRGGLITSIQVVVGGDSAFEGTARTPADTPIVLVAGHRSEQGTLQLAATGVDSTPILVNPSGDLATEPPSDFRGSGGYRRELLRVLSARVLAKLEGGSA